MPSAALYHYHLDRGRAVPVPGKTEAFQISGTTELNKSVDLGSSFLLARSVPFRNGLRTSSDVTGMGADDALGRLSFVDADTVHVHRGSGDGSAPQFLRGARRWNSPAAWWRACSGAASRSPAG